MLRTAVLLFLIGATLGSALDAIHTHSGTTVYAHEIAFKMAWWTPLLFGAAGVAIGLGPLLVERFTSAIGGGAWARAPRARRRSAPSGG